MVSVNTDWMLYEFAKNNRRETIARRIEWYKAQARDWLDKFLECDWSIAKEQFELYNRQAGELRDLAIELGKY